MQREQQEVYVWPLSFFYNELSSRYCCLILYRINDVDARYITMKMNGKPFNPISNAIISYRPIARAIAHKQSMMLRRFLSCLIRRFGSFSFWNSVIMSSGTRTRQLSRIIQLNSWYSSCNNIYDSVSCQDSKSGNNRNQSD